MRTTHLNMLRRHGFAPRTLLRAALCFGLTLPAAAGMPGGFSAPEMASTESFGPTLELAATDARVTALRFIRETELNRNLSLLILNDVKTTPEVAALVERYGFEAAKTIVVRLIRDAQGTYGAAWDEVMADLYQQHFTAGELASLVADHEASPHFSRLMNLQADLGAGAREKGSTVIAAARARVLGEVAALTRS